MASITKDILVSVFGWCAADLHGCLKRHIVHLSHWFCTYRITRASSLLGLFISLWLVDFLFLLVLTPLFHTVISDILSLGSMFEDFEVNRCYLCLSYESTLVGIPDIFWFMPLLLLKNWYMSPQKGTIPRYKGVDRPWQKLCVTRLLGSFHSWRIIPLSKRLITIVSKLPNDLTS